MSSKQILAVTMGEPAGIGPEITLEAWARAPAESSQAFYVIADPLHMQAVAAKLDRQVPVIKISDPAEALAVFNQGLPVLDVGQAVDLSFGLPQPDAAGAVIRSIDLAVEHVHQGLAQAVVTNPVHKASLYSAGFSHPGHTEYLGHLCHRHYGQWGNPVMMLAVPGLRVVPLTVHVAFAQVPQLVTSDAITSTLQAMHAALSADFGIKQPRIAVAGLNPHAGEEGTIGNEEKQVIAPAVKVARELGLNATGPWPADSLFHKSARAKHDAVLCMYHDQALIPLKTIDFDRGVNITLGLPIVRTSPDHGTAFDIAGTGKASAASLIEAIRTAGEIARRRALQTL